MIIDGHSHVTLPVEAHILAMNQAGVDKTILFSTTIHPETGKNTAEVKASMEFLHDLLAGRKGNLTEARKKSIDELVEVINSHPDRYIGFGNVPIDLEEKEIKQYIQDNIINNHLAGMGEFTPGNGQIHRLEKVFKASREFDNLPLWIHAFFPLDLKDIIDIAKFAKQYPNTPVILGHLGGCNWMETISIVKEIPNLYLDTSAFYSTLILGLVINEIPQKCIFGVDSPYGDLQLCKTAIKKYSKSSEIASAVLGDNISLLLKL